MNDAWTAIRRAAGVTSAIASTAALTGCGQKTQQAAAPQVWSTKSDSLLGASTDAPTLNLERPIPAAASAEELREPALTLLRQAADAPSPLLRANAIEALQLAPEAVESVVQRALADENRGVRFVAAMTVGKLKLQNLADLLEPLLHDESESVQAAAIYGLRRVGRKADLNPLARMLLSEDPEVKANAALVLGELGDRSAIPMLTQAVGRGAERMIPARRKMVDLQVAEAMVKLGAANHMDVIRAALFAQAEEQELAVLACQMYGDLRDPNGLADLINLVHRSGRFERPPEVRMAAAVAVARIDPAKRPFDVPLAYIEETRPELRMQAAHSLAWIAAQGGSQPEAVQAVSQLSRLLNDPHPLVQVAAAGGILRLSQPRSSTWPTLPS